MRSLISFKARFALQQSKECYFCRLLKNAEQRWKDERSVARDDDRCNSA